MNTPLTEVYFDAKTSMGPWANMCQACFYRYGIKLGTGFGQKYERQPAGNWKKTAG